MESKDHLFTVWLTDKDWDAMPYLNEICVASAQVANKKSITIYTNHKLHLSFLDRTITKIEQIPDEIMRHVQKITDNKAHQSDYLRLWYLFMYGGIYFDTDILFWKSFGELWDEMFQSGNSVLYPLEDKNMICNCMIMCCNTENASPFFTDMLNNYDDRYIKHSYLFNSQKYMWLMSRRYKDNILLYNKPSLFGGTWNDTNSIQNFILEENPKGIGQHLYNSDKELWGTVRESIDMNCYNNEPDTFPTKLTKSVIDKYIDLMKEADNE